MHMAIGGLGVCVFLCALCKEDRSARWKPVGKGV